MAIETTKESSSADVVGGRRGMTRHVGLVAAGLMAVAALGYTVVDAPGSSAQGDDAQKEAPNEPCANGKGSVTISKDGSGFKATAKGEFPGECAGNGSGSATDISAEPSDDGKACVIKTSKLKGKGKEDEDDDGNGKKDEIEIENGTVTITLQLDGKTGKLDAKVKSGPEGPDADDIFAAKAKINNHGVTSCDSVPTGDFTVTDIDTTQSEAPE
ncbi:hypothetical protein [Nocardia suismassiliense]|uniref:hypothetical protein n=1 Tax=Nocardia suismassiliense TaxID=2077092 RepID=UPI000D1F0E80|nr:hypothetical protein [Nocardia suismassiliense]